MRQTQERTVQKRHQRQPAYQKINRALPRIVISSGVGPQTTTETFATFAAPLMQTWKAESRTEPLTYRPLSHTLTIIAHRKPAAGVGKSGPANSVVAHQLLSSRSYFNPIRTFFLFFRALTQRYRRFLYICSYIEQSPRPGESEDMNQNIYAGDVENLQS